MTFLTDNLEKISNRRRSISLGQLPLTRRQAVGTISLVAGIATLALIYLRSSSLRAYITGDIIEVKAPMEGLVTVADIQTGELIRSTKPLLEVHASKRGQEELASTKLQLEKINTQIDRITLELQFLQRSSLKSIEDELLESKSKISELESQHSHYSILKTRMDSLEQQGAIPLSTMLATKSKFRTLQAQLTYESKLEQDLTLKLQEAQKQYSRPDSYKPLSPRPLEPHDLEISNRRLELHSLHDQRKRVQSQIKLIEDRNTFIYEPAFKALLLNQYVHSENEVTKGSSLVTLVNCETLRVEALFEPRKVRNVHPGDSLNITSLENNHDFKGTVLSKQWESINLTRYRTGNAVFPDSKTERVRMHISIRNNGLNNSCPYGEPVRVNI